MSRKDQDAKNAYQRAWYAKRKGKKPGQAWRPGGPGRPPNGAKAMMPACSLPGGKMRESHVFDEDGLCDCGARATTFAPRPELRPEMVKTRPTRPEPPAPRSVPVVAKKPAQPKPTKPAVRQPALAPTRAPVLELLIGGQPVSAIVADLEGRRDALGRAIAALRDLQGMHA